MRRTCPPGCGGWRRERRARGSRRSGLRRGPSTTGPFDVATLTAWSPALWPPTRWADTPGTNSSSPSTQRTRRAKLASTSACTSAASITTRNSLRAAYRAGPERHLAVLDDELRVRVRRQVPDVVVVEVADDDQFDRIGVHAQQLEPVDRGAQKGATPPGSRPLVEAEVDHDVAEVAADEPHEVVDRIGLLVGVRRRAVEVVAAGGHIVAVLDRVDLHVRWRPAARGVRRAHRPSSW